MTQTGSCQVGLAAAEWVKLSFRTRWTPAGRCTGRLGHTKQVSSGQRMTAQGHSAQPRAARYMTVSPPGRERANSDGSLMELWTQKRDTAANGSLKMACRGAGRRTGGAGVGGWRSKDTCRQLIPWEQERGGRQEELLLGERWQEGDKRRKTPPGGQAAWACRTSAELQLSRRLVPRRSNGRCSGVCPLLALRDTDLLDCFY